MADSSVLIAVPKSVWSHFRPAAEARGILPSRMMLELLRKVAEDGLVAAVLDGEPAPKPEPITAPVAAKVMKKSPAPKPAPTIVTAPEPAPLVEVAETLPPTVKRQVRKAESVLPREVPELDIPFHLRRRNLDAAIALLKRHCILVFPANRDADVMRYRVSGVRESQLAEAVIWIAMGYGFEVIDA